MYTLQTGTSTISGAANQLSGFTGQVGGLASLLGPYDPYQDEALKQAQARIQQMNQLHTLAAMQKQPVAPIQQPKPNLKGKSMFTEVARDIKSFLLEHRSTLYFIAIALILDHLLFKDAFRHRLQGMADKMITKVEEKVGK